MVLVVQGNGSCLDCLGYVSPIDDHLAGRLAPIRRGDVASRSSPPCPPRTARSSSSSLNDQSSVVATVSRWRRANETYIEAMPYSNVCPPLCKQTFMSGGGRTALSPLQKHFRVETCHKSESTPHASVDQQTTIWVSRPAGESFPCTRQHCFIFFPLSAGQRRRQRPMLSMVNEGLSDHL